MDGQDGNYLGRIILESIYESIMSQMHVVACNDREWADDFYDWFTGSSDVCLGSLELISMYDHLNRTGYGPCSIGDTIPVGKWLDAHHKAIESSEE